MTDRRIILGVTGNIAVGKSTVVRRLVEHGAHHIDADLVYRDLVKPGMPLLNQIRDAFGPGILAADGSLDRKALGAIVFNDPAALARLDALTHPAILAESDRRALAIPSGVVVFDSVKLIESGHHKICDEVWLVEATIQTQIDRVIQRNGTTHDEAVRRVQAQPPLEPKRAAANVIITNDGTLDDLLASVDDAWTALIDKFDLSPSETTMRTKIDFYFDYQCPYAWTAQQWIWQVKDALGDDLDITWKFFSIEQVNKADDAPNLWELPNDGTHVNMRAFQGALAAMNQGEAKFRAFHSALYDQRHRANRNIGTQRILEQTAADAGLDMDKFRADLDSDAAFTKLRDDFTSAKETLGVFGVPTIVFENGNAAYLKIRIDDVPTDPVEFWNEFVQTVRDRDNILEIKRPTPPRH